MLLELLPGNPVGFNTHSCFFISDPAVSHTLVTSVLHVWLKASHLSRFLKGFGPVFIVKKWM